MDLFSENQITNLLPYDGTVLYYGTVMPQAEANHYFNELYNNIEWRHDEGVVFGKKAKHKNDIKTCGALEDF